MRYPVGTKPENIKIAVGEIVPGEAEEDTRLTVEISFAIGDVWSAYRTDASEYHNSRVLGEHIGRDMAYKIAPLITQAIMDASQRQLEEEGIPEPQVGDDIYVRSSYYIDHGVDDFRGGLCKIKKVVRHPDCPNSTNRIFVTIEERPGHQYNWKLLLEEQDKLREQFGDERGYEDPDPADPMTAWRQRA